RTSGHSQSAYSFRRRPLEPAPQTAYSLAIATMTRSTMAPPSREGAVATRRREEARGGAMDRVGVIGLGKMGLPIARNLMVRGFRVTGYRRSGSPELVKEGGEVAASAAGVAAAADVIVSIVPTA